VTEQVLDLIDRKMLLTRPDKRIRSKELCLELEQLVKSATKSAKDWNTKEKQEKRQSIERMEDMLSVIDKEAEAAAGPDQVAPEPSCDFEPGLPVNRGALKVQLQNTITKKTSHRFETIASAQHHNLEPVTAMPTIASSDTDGPEQVLQGVSTRTTNSSAVKGRRRSQRQATALSRTSTGAPSRGTTDVGPMHACQNVIQARKQMERERKKKERKSLGLLPGKKRQKDDYLSKYFKDRDIVSHPRDIPYQG
jgi:hypothetical protein